MIVDMAVTVTMDGALPDELRQLRTWLLSVDELRGRVQLVERAPDPNRLEPLLEGLRIRADPSSAALAPALVAWVKQHRSSVKVRVTGPDGRRISIEAERVRLMGGDDLSELTDRVAHVTGTEVPGLRREASAPDE
jgi:hypothetical protein